jgi:3-hydroxybutyrate dehydrogenase
LLLHCPNKWIGWRAKVHGIARDEVVRNVLLAQQPNKRSATTDELGGIAVFFTSDAAASTTGTTIAVDGGWIAH